MRNAHITDIHLDFLKEQQILEFATRVADSGCSGVLLTGDISNTKNLTYHLSILERVIQKPIMFVAGNHDFYGVSIAAVRKSLAELSNMSQFLRYMPTVPYIALSPTTAVVGHDGWYDALYGDWNNSPVMMSDWAQIRQFGDLSGLPLGAQFNGRIEKGSIVALSRKLAHEGTMHVHNGIKAAARYHKSIIVLTHFPPFAESALYHGKQTDPDYLPWYTSKFMGDMLRDSAKSFPNIR